MICPYCHSPMPAGAWICVPCVHRLMVEREKERLSHEGGTAQQRRWRRYNRHRRADGRLPSRRGARGQGK